MEQRVKIRRELMAVALVPLTSIVYWQCCHFDRRCVRHRLAVAVSCSPTVQVVFVVIGVPALVAVAFVVTELAAVMAPVTG